MRWEKEEIYINNELFFKDLLNAFEKARSNIFLETYIFENDFLGKKVVETLNAAVDRGVDVKVVLDAVGSHITPFSEPFFSEKAKFLYKVYHPFSFKFSSINKRNHRKICLIDTYIDQGIAFVGSQNMTSVHLPIEKGGLGWRDTAVFVKGEQIKELEKSFIELFEGIHLNQFSKKNALFKTVRLNQSFRARRFFYLDLIKKIRFADEKIWFSTPYFVPNRKILQRIKKMASKGVDVRVLLPQTSDVFFMPWVADSFYESLLRSGVKIYEYKKSFLHAKMMMIDSWITIGSTNLNHRSLFHDLEVDIVLTHEENKIKAQEIFLEDLRTSKEVTLESFQRKPLWRKWIGRILLVFRYFL